MYDGAESGKIWSDRCASLAQCFLEAHSTIGVLNNDLQELRVDDEDERAELRF
jgi:hypothetical protein